MFPPAVPTLQVSDVPSGALFLDVREQDEWDSGHIDGAVHIPLGSLVARLGEVPRDRTVYLMCAVGGRSAQATQFLAAQGVDAVNIDGGITAWHRSGLPVVTGAPS